MKKTPVFLWIQESRREGVWAYAYGPDFRRQGHGRASPRMTLRFTGRRILLECQPHPRDLLHAFADPLPCILTVCLPEEPDVSVREEEEVVNIV